MALWRSKAIEKKYDEYRAGRDPAEGCALCREPSLVEFQYWRVTNNRFPYDQVASLHHMMVPKRHTNGDDLTPEEFSELALLKKEHVNEHYNFILEATPKTKSIPTHYHLHLVVAKEVL